MNHRLLAVPPLYQRAAQRLFRRFQLILLIVVVAGLAACSDTSDRRTPGKPNSLIPIPEALQEVAPPATLQALSKELDVRPQVQITAPQNDAVLQDNKATVRFQVSDFPTFKDENLGMGPHLHVIVDNEPYRAIYNPAEPLILEDLEPGTHTIRAFASRPWHESFKTAGAYAQVQFHVFTRTPGPDLEMPLLTYSRPKGEYGAEPIMLDVYLRNAPLHMLAQEDSEDAIADWKVRCTVNGQTFTFDAWEPIYLTGFQPGKNWLQLELLDEDDNPIPNAYNNTARLITYTPGGSDTLSQLVRGELSVQAARSIIIEGYVPPEPPSQDAALEAAPETATEVPSSSDTEAEDSVPQALTEEGDPTAVDASSNAELDKLPAAMPAATTPTPEAPEPAPLPELEAVPPGLLLEETLPAVTSSASEASAEQAPKDPEPAALPESEIPAGLLMEETLPELTPAASAIAEPKETEPLPEPLPSIDASPGLLVEETLPELAPMAAPVAE